jgi:penicillin-binding protein 2
MSLYSPRESAQDIHRRIRYLFIAVTVLFAVLFLRVWYLQIAQGDYYTGLSENNRVRIVHLQPQRGLIFDRAGNLLVNNVPSFNLYLVAEDIPDMKSLIERLRQLVALPPAELEEKLSSSRTTVPYMPIKIKEGLSLREVAVLEAHRMELPGLHIEPEPQRNYLHGTSAAHVLGHVGEITASQLLMPENAGVVSGGLIGQYGVEKSYDAYVRGAVGQKVIEVNAMGHEVKVLKVVDPVPGNDIYLTLDLSLQGIAEEALENESGAIVAMNPRNGEILAMASRPAFDPNLLSRGLTPAQWEAISQDPGHPLTHRAMQGQYPPGSVFKLVVTAAALETGQMDSDFKVSCRGWLPFGGRIYQDWKAGGHGVMDLHQAIVQSCDVFFYELGQRVGIDGMARYANLFGLGQPTGIELLSEKAGLIPDTEWKKKVRQEPWYPGETLSAAIGQGYITVTPLQMANFIGTIAVSGERYQPHLIKAIRERSTGRLFEFPPVRLNEVNVSPRTFSVLREALAGVVLEPEGTGGAARSKWTTIAGKTGTAQVVTAKPGVKTKSLPKELQDHAWFVAFAPVEDPRIAVAVLIEHGGHGGSAAAPRAKKLIEAYLKNDQPTPHQQL